MPGVRHTLIPPNTWWFLPCSPNPITSSTLLSTYSTSSMLTMGTNIYNHIINLNLWTFCKFQGFSHQWPGLVSIFTLSGLAYPGGGHIKHHCGCTITYLYPDIQMQGIGSEVQFTTIITCLLDLRRQAPPIEHLFPWIVQRPSWNVLSVSLLPFLILGGVGHSFAWQDTRPSVNCSSSCPNLFWQSWSFRAQLSCAGQNWHRVSK